MKRRSFVTGAAIGLPALALPAWAAAPPVPTPAKPDDRAYWLATLLRVVDPLLTAAARPSVTPWIRNRLIS